MTKFFWAQKSVQKSTVASCFLNPVQVTSAQFGQTVLLLKLKVS